MKTITAFEAEDGQLFKTSADCKAYEVSLAQKKRHGSLLRVVPHITDRMGISRSAWWKGVKDGKYPPGIKLSPRVTVWKSTDIDTLIASLGS
jgi:predicted DNA-binding transcriptional regulator AlpA